MARRFGESAADVGNELAVLIVATQQELQPKAPQASRPTWHGKADVD